MGHPVFLYGAGGHAKVILELLEAEGRVIHGLFDDNATADNLFDYPVKPWPEGYSEGADCIISIGHNATRQKIAQKLEVPFTKASHPNSYLSPRCSLENGTVVMSGVSIHSGASIGRHCIINTHASVDHDCELGDFVHIAPRRGRHYPGGLDRTLGRDWRRRRHTEGCSRLCDGSRESGPAFFTHHKPG